MTHFVLYVIVPKEIAEVPPERDAKGGLDYAGMEEYIGEVMEPYSENLEMTPYVVKSKLAVMREMRKVNKEHPDFAEKMDGKTLAEAYMAWAGQKLDRHGNALSTWNKKAIWDWYAIGGRWNGRLTGATETSDDGYNFDKKCKELHNNFLKVGDFLEKYDKDVEGMGCHVVIKNGRLHSPGRHGWFGTFSQKNKKLTEKQIEARWEKRFRGLFNSTKKDYVVNVDCHV